MSLEDIGVFFCSFCTRTDRTILLSVLFSAGYSPSNFTFSLFLAFCRVRKGLCGSTVRASYSCTDHSSSCLSGLIYSAVRANIHAFHLFTQ